MKNLDLNNYGVQEMNAVEMKEVEGGFFAELIAVAFAIGVLVEAGLAIYNAIKKS